VWDANIKMRASCGTLSYVAPEVLKKSYTSKCDLWSLGVIVFILVAGYMPFAGSEATQVQNINNGSCKMKPERWANISHDGRAFVDRLLKVDPAARLSAPQALEHAWIVQRNSSKNLRIDSSVVDALRQFSQASKFRRYCLEMMAWSLSNEERAKVRQDFLAMDQNKQGTITLAELKKVLQDSYHIPEDETHAIFHALDTNHDEEIHYSDFLAAMVSTRIALHDDLLHATFSKFDTDNSGYITVSNLREVLGESYDEEQINKLVADADQVKDGRISYAEFVTYLRGDALEEQLEAAQTMVDSQFKQARVSRCSERLTLEMKNLQLEEPKRTKRNQFNSKACCIV